MKKLLFISIVFLSCFTSIAQVTFEKSFGGINIDSVSCVKKTSDGGYIICGSTNSFGAGNYDVMVTKINSYGTKLWSKTFGGTGEDHGNAIKQTSDGGYIIVGSTKNNNETNQNIYLVKIDAAGGLTWSETIGNDSADQGNDVIQTFDGGYAVTGYSDYSGTKTAYLVRVGANGSAVSEKHLTYKAEGKSLIQTADGGFVISGTMINSPGADGWNILMKVDNSGNGLWTKIFTSDYSYEGMSLMPASDGGFMIGASAENQDLNISAACLLKTNSSGGLEWTKFYNAGEGVSFQQTSDNGYIISGNRFSAPNNSDIYLIKTDSVGSQQWATVMGGANNEMAVSVIQTNDLGYMVSGSLGTSNFDGFLFKTNTTGGTSCSTNTLTVTDSLIISNEYNVMMIADLYGLMPTISFIETAFANQDITSTAICAVVTPADAVPLDSGLAEIPADTTSSPDSITAVHGPAAIKPAINGSENRIDDKGNHENEEFNKTISSIMNSEASMESLNVFPNPANGENVNISISTSKAQKVLVVVYDELGRESYSKVIFTGDSSESIFAIDPSGKLKPGIYMIAASSEKTTLMKRLIVK
jgi:hypothetical protein